MPKKRKPAETFDEFLAAVVAGRMEKRGKRQEDVAEAIGMPLSNYGRRMRGKVPFTANELWAVASYLGFDPGEMLAEAIADAGGAGSVLSEVRAKNDTPDDDAGVLDNVTQLSRRESKGVEKERQAALKGKKESEQ